MFGFGLNQANCPFCGAFQVTTTTDHLQFEKERIAHIFKCTTTRAEQYGVDISEMLPKRQYTINEMVFESESDDDDDDYMDDEEEEELEQEIDDLEKDQEMLKALMEGVGKAENGLKLMFKFMNGLFFEGKFKPTDPIHSVVRWLSEKSQQAKETIALRINNQVFENIKVLNNCSTLEELSIKSNTQVMCFVREI